MTLQNAIIIIKSLVTSDKYTHFDPHEHFENRNYFDNLIFNCLKNQKEKGGYDLFINYYLNFYGLDIVHLKLIWRIVHKVHADFKIEFD